MRAAAVPETFFTVWANLFDIGRLQPGETVLIHGGSSGIGTTAIQLAHAPWFSRVFVTAGSAATSARPASSSGPKPRSTTRTPKTSPTRIKQLTGGRGVDVVLDMIGGPYAQNNLRCLAMDGRLVLIAFLGGSKVETLRHARPS